MVDTDDGGVDEILHASLLGYFEKSFRTLYVNRRCVALWGRRRMDDDIDVFER